MTCEYDDDNDMTLRFSNQSNYSKEDDEDNFHTDNDAVDDDDDNSTFGESRGTQNWWVLGFSAKTRGCLSKPAT